MADYARSIVSVLYSENSDYSDPMVARSYVSEYTAPTMCDTGRIIVNTAGDDYLDVRNYTSIKYMVLKNMDSTNYVSVLYKNTGNNANSVAAETMSFKLLAGETAYLPDVGVSDVIGFTAHTANVLIEYVLVGIS
jgi:hypothetical protein